MRIRWSLLIVAMLSGTGLQADVSVCSLITRDEIRAARGETVTSAKESTRAGEKVSVSQCIYVLPTYSRSVSLELISPVPGGAAAHPARQMWNDRIRNAFHDSREAEERDEPEVKRVRIRGLGDEAFWIQNRPNGELYVLSGESFLKLIIAGPESEAVKIERGKRLLREAVKRLNGRK